MKTHTKILLTIFFVSFIMGYCSMKVAKADSFMMVGVTITGYDAVITKRDKVYLFLKGGSDNYSQTFLQNRSGQLTNNYFAKKHKETKKNDYFYSDGLHNVKLFGRTALGTDGSTLRLRVRVD